MLASYLVAYSLACTEHTAIPLCLYRGYELGEGVQGSVEGKLVE